MTVTAAPFAQSFAGQFLVPLLVILTSAAIVGGIGFALKIAREFRAVIEIVLAVKAEVLPNGGGSMRDAVNRTELKQEKLSRQLKKHLADTAVRRSRSDVMYDDYLERMADNKVAA